MLRVSDLVCSAKYPKVKRAAEDRKRWRAMLPDANKYNTIQYNTIEGECHKPATKQNTE